MSKKNFAQAITGKSKALPALSKQDRIRQNLLILPEIKSFIRPLDTEEKLALKENIAAFGIKDPLAVWEVSKKSLLSTDGFAPNTLRYIKSQADDILFVLIDGHNRLEIAHELRIEFPAVVINFPDNSNLEDIYNYMSDYQIGRRNLTANELSYFRGRKYNSLKKGVGGNNEEAEDASKKLAEEFKVSPNTIKRDGKFSRGVDKLNAETKHAVLGGKIKGAKEKVSDLANQQVSNVDADLLDEISLNNRSNKAKDSSTVETIVTDELKQGVLYENMPSNELIKSLKIYVQEQDLSISETVEKVIDMAQLLLKRQAKVSK